MFITIIITVIANPHIHLSLSLDKYLMATNATADVLMLFISYCSRVCINTAEKLPPAIIFEMAQLSLAAITGFATLVTRWDVSQTFTARHQ